ncbi:MAG: hypothetical protein D6E12_07485 [Desulfovibrio sp.]|nr:MAG: hypothetical protein D6E12_07485 [Desulfovibrio sp.]
MNILILTGSPKGEKSVTLQYANWLKARFPGHEWTTVHVASRIKGIEASPERFNELMDQVRRADVILWTFPLYVLLVPAGLKRFIELVSERGAEDTFAGKYAASLSTSIHFHDNIAHDYLQGVSEDLGMRFVAAHSPAMRDLTKDKGRKQLESFGRLFLDTAKSGQVLSRRFPPLAHQGWTYTPSPATHPVDLGSKRVVIVHDALEQDANLRAMVQRLRCSFAGEVAVHNLHDVDMRANCLGCLRCAMHNSCVQEERDGFVPFYRKELISADIIILAGTMRDRHFSSRWRRFWERGFFQTHQPTLKGKQIAFLVAGPLGQAASLQEWMSGWTQWQEAHLAGMLSDEAGESALLDQELTGLAQRLAQCAEEEFVRPKDFQGVGGLKIFRDDIYGPLRFVFQADHKYYKRNKYYDFPTWDWSMRMLNTLLTPLFRIPRLRRVFERRMKDKMIEPLQKWVDKAKIDQGSDQPVYPALDNPAPNTLAPRGTTHAF